MTEPAGGKYLPALTGLRWVLALWVIFHHLTGPGQSLEPAALALPRPVFTLIRGGYLAVTTFFVLSGFVAARSHAMERWSGRTLLHYFAGRVARVYPVYLFSLAVIAPFIAADQTPRKMRYVAEYLLLLQGWFGNTPVHWNTPAWTLSCEMFFYLAFPFLGAPVAKAGWRGTLAAAAAAICLTRVMLAMGAPDELKPVIHLSDFLMGIAASRAYDLRRAAGTAPRGSWLYLPAGAMIAVFIAYPQMLPPRVDLNTALRPLNAVLLIGLAYGGGLVARALSLSPIVFLGKASYAIYILHVPLLWWYMRWSREFSAALYLAVVIAVSVPVYRFIEVPANRYLRSRARGALQG